MSINRKSKPNDVVESSSNDEETISTINTRPTEGPSSPDSQCPICLDELSNPCNTNSCLHLFCFECLQRWSNSAQFCPLCRKTFICIHHSFDDLGVHATYAVNIQVPIWVRPQPNEQIVRTMRSMPGHIVPPVLYADNGIGDILFHHTISETPLIGTDMRTYMYNTNAWADPLPDSTDRTLDSNLANYRANPPHSHRLFIFILREVVAIRESLRVEGEAMPLPNITDLIVTNYIMQLLLSHEIRQLHLLNVLRPILDLHAVQFCHELYNFARSPYDIRDYDLNFTFTLQPSNSEFTEPLPSETSALNSDNEGVQRPMIMTNVSSSTNDSDAVLSHSFRSIEPLISESIDQPTTSTGIQDLLNQPNNIFQSVDGDSFPCPSHLRRMPNSSDDEDSIIATRSSKTSHIKSRDINNKKKKTRKSNNKKKINTNDSGSETPSTNRNRSYSESSSTSGETDTN